MTDRRIDVNYDSCYDGSGIKMHSPIALVRSCPQFQPEILIYIVCLFNLSYHIWYETL